MSLKTFVTDCSYLNAFKSSIGAYHSKNQFQMTLLYFPSLQKKINSIHQPEHLLQTSP